MGLQVCKYRLVPSSFPYLHQFTVIGWFEVAPEPAERPFNESENNPETDDGAFVSIFYVSLILVLLFFLDAYLDVFRRCLGHSVMTACASDD